MPYVVPRYIHTRATLCILRRLGYLQAYCPASPFFVDIQRLQKPGLFLTSRGGFGPRGHPCPLHRLAPISINLIDRRSFIRISPFYGRGSYTLNFRLSLRPNTAWGVTLKDWHPYFGSTRNSRPPGLVLATSLAVGSPLSGKFFFPRHRVFNEKHFDEGKLALGGDFKLNTLVHIEYYAYITYYLRKGNQQIIQYLLCTFSTKRFF